MPDSMNDRRITDRIFKQLETQSADIRDLTGSIGGLTVVLARKEATDAHVLERVEEVRVRVDNNTKRISAIENNDAKVASILEIQKWIWRAVIGGGVTTAMGAIMWVVSQGSK